MPESNVAPHAEQLGGIDILRNQRQRCHPTSKIGSELPPRRRPTYRSTLASQMTLPLYRAGYRPTTAFFRRCHGVPLLPLARQDRTAVGEDSPGLDHADKRVLYGQQAGAAVQSGAGQTSRHRLLGVLLCVWVVAAQ